LASSWVFQKIRKHSEYPPLVNHLIKFILFQLDNEVCDKVALAHIEAALLETKPSLTKSDKIMHENM